MSDKPKTTVGVGGMWEETTEKGVFKFSIALDPKTLPPPDAKGRIRLTAMVNTFKGEQKEGAPDFNVFYGIKDNAPQDDHRSAPAARPQGRGYSGNKPGRY